MVKAEWVFNDAMALMDEFSVELSPDGRYYPNETDTEEYRARSVAIINMLAGELYPYSDTYVQPADGKRAICPKIHELEDAMPIDDYCAITVLPYGLAAHLLLQEDPNTAAFFQQRYDELKRNITIGMTSISQDIVDVYAGYQDDNGVWHNFNDPLGYKEYGWW